MSSSPVSRSLLRASVAVCALVASAGTAFSQDVASNGVETVTVLGQAIYVAPSATPPDAIQPTSIVQEGFIQNNIIPQSSYDDIIKFEPSVYDQSPNGPGLGKSETLSIRGFQDGQFNVTFDGIPFGDSTDLHHTSSALFIAHDLGQAEVDRGPGGASTIGKATFGGTVGFVTKKTDTDFSVNPYATYGSFDTSAVGLELNSGVTKYGSGFVDVQHESTGGYLTYSGEHRNNYMGKWIYDIDDTLSVTLLGTFNKEFQYTTQGATLQNIQTYGRNFALTNNPQTQAFYGYNPSVYVSDFYYVDVNKTIGHLNIHNKTYTDYFAHVYTEGKDASDTVPADNTLTTYPAPSNPLFYNPVAYASSQGVKSNDIPGKQADARFRAWGDTLDNSYDLGFGVAKFGAWFDSQHDFRWSDTIDLSKNGAMVPGKNGTAYSYYYHTLSQTWQPYVEFDWKVLDDLTLTPGVKYTAFNRHVNGPINKSGVGAIDYKDNYTSLQPSVSALYTIDDGWTSYLQVAKGFLAPPVAVFQVTAPHTIKPETTMNYQAGTTYQHDNYTVSFDAYYINFSNFFASIQLPGTTNTEYVNGGGALYRGLEAEGQYAFGGGWSAYANGSLNGASYKGNNVQIAESPDYTASLGLLYNAPQGLYGSLIGKLIGPRWGLDGDSLNPATQQLVAMDQYHFGSLVTFDLSAGYKITHSDEISHLAGLTVSIKISNIMNNRQIDDYAGAQAAGAALPLYWTVAGRSYFLNLSTNLN